MNEVEGECDKISDPIYQCKKQRKGVSTRNLIEGSGKAQTEKKHWKKALMSHKTNSEIKRKT